MKWKDVPRILTGSLPSPSELPTLEDYNAVSDGIVQLLMATLKDNFRNVTEMDAVIRVGIIVLLTVKGMNVEIRMQPSFSIYCTG